MIRIAALNDLSAIISIYNEAVAMQFATADMTPVTVESRHGWFNEHEPANHPIFVWEGSAGLMGWCSLSPYRRGRTALRFTAEISYYVCADSRRKGIASAMLRHSLAMCPSLQIKNLFAIVLDRNMASRCLLEKLEFEKWGFLPRVADFDGQECGHWYYGRRIGQP